MRFSVYDRLLILVSVILCAVIFIVVYYMRQVDSNDFLLTIDASGKRIVSEKLSSVPEGKINIEGPLGVCVAEIKDGKVRMLESPCPDKVCLKTGWLSANGTIVCLPQKVVIRLTPIGTDVDEEGLDAVVE